MRVVSIGLMLASLTLIGCGTPASKDHLQPPAPVAPAAPAAMPQPEPAAQPAPSLQPVAATAATADAADAAADNEVVCRNEKPLGTRIGKRVCKTRAQFRQEEESARQMMKNRDTKSHGVTDPITGGN